MTKKAVPKNPPRRTRQRPGRKKGVVPDVVTPRESLFVAAVLAGKTYTAAYLESGYKPTTPKNAGALAARLVKKDRVAAAIAAGRAKLAARWEASQDRILEELVNLGYSDIRKIFQADGMLVNPVDLDDRTAAAVQSVEVVERPGLIDKKTIETVHKIKLHGKVESLTLMARMLGLLKDKVEHSGTVHHISETATDEELLGQIDAILATARKRGQAGKPA